MVSVLCTVACTISRLGYNCISAEGHCCTVNMTGHKTVRDTDRDTWKACVVSSKWINRHANQSFVMLIISLMRFLSWLCSFNFTELSKDLTHDVLTISVGNVMVISVMAMPCDLLVDFMFSSNLFLTVARSH